MRIKVLKTECFFEISRQDQIRRLSRVSETVCVFQLAVPFSLNLLPGQILTLREVVEKEKVRRKPLPSPPTAAPAPATKIVTIPNIPPGLDETYLPIPTEMPVYVLLHATENIIVNNSSFVSL